MEASLFEHCSHSNFACLHERRVADLPYGYVEDDAGVKDDGSGGGGAVSQPQERIDVVPGGGSDGTREEEAPGRQEEEPFFVTHGDTKVRYSTFLSGL